jgi:hypothetical protein
MKFFDSTTEDAIVQDVWSLSGTDTNSYTLKQVTRSVNGWLRLVQSWILGADGRFQYDDSNYTDLPIATTDLVSGQDNYSFDSTWLEIIKVEAAQDSTVSTWNVLKPFDVNDVNNYSEFQDVAGVPAFYDVVGSSVILKPASNFNATAGLKFYFKRKASEFVSTDTTKEPGFASPYHRILSLGAAYDYCMANSVRNPVGLRNEIEVLKQELLKHYSRRDKVEIPRIGRISRYK